MGLCPELTFDAVTPQPAHIVTDVAEINREYWLHPTVTSGTSLSDLSPQTTCVYQLKWSNVAWISVQH